jgi:hypothetical protein
MGYYGLLLAAHQTSKTIASYTNICTETGYFSAYTETGYIRTYFASTPKPVTFSAYFASTPKPVTFSAYIETGYFRHNNSNKVEVLTVQTSIKVEVLTVSPPGIYLSIKNIHHLHG